MRLLLQHRSHYGFSSPAALGPHVVRLRPATHAKAKVESYALGVPDGAVVHWQLDPFGNNVARLSFARGTRFRSFDISVDLAVDIKPVNPFDFFVDDRYQVAPFAYAPELRNELLPFLGEAGSQVPAFAGGARLEAFLRGLPSDGPTVPLVVELNRLVAQRVRYVIRDELGIWTPEDTLEQGRGSCRDSAVLLIAVLRSRGFAARFVSGYLVQLTDEGMIPGAPRGVGRDVADLHAWAEVFLPGAGWIGLDATSGLLCGEGHIPLACTAIPALAAPIEGTSEHPAGEVTFELTIRRLGHEPRPTKPYEDDVWEALLNAGDAVDAALAGAPTGLSDPGGQGEQGVLLTMGGEPTFNAREHVDAPEWNGAALGPTKWSCGTKLVEELRRRLVPGGAVLVRQGKHYPGESLPRWALDIIGRSHPTDGAPVWDGDVILPASYGGAPAPEPKEPHDAVKGHEGARRLRDARRLVEAIARRLAVRVTPIPAFEDPWRFVQDEASLPVDEDPLRFDLDEPEERRRLARVLDRGLGREVGFVLPLRRAVGCGVRGAPSGEGWESEVWDFRRGHLFLLQGDSPIGLRLPLKSLSAGAPAPTPVEEEYAPRDPRRPSLDEPDDASAAQIGGATSGRTNDHPNGPVGENDPAQRGAAPKQKALAPSKACKPALPPPKGVRTALCVEPRAGAIYVFLPPLESAEDFLALVREIGAARKETGVDVLLEGYPPPSSPMLTRVVVTPDPGVLEVNLPVTTSVREHAALMETVFDAALHAGLHSEKYLLDGRQAGSGGGNHLTLGGPTPLSSPFLQRPDILASLLAFIQHHPSLSYMFTGLFVGPTSQAPRVDEARHDSLYELEIALQRAFEEAPSRKARAADAAGRRDGNGAAATSATAPRHAGRRPPPPWLGDALFRHLLVDLAGNTHRSEVCIDKLFDPQTAHGRQGVVELRAFEMPPHYRMVTAQMTLVRALIAAFAQAPYDDGRGTLVRYGQTLHDRFLLPYWMWRDFEDVLGFLASRGLALPTEAYRPFIELRCPVAGRIQAGDVMLEVRNAIEPWHVLGEELTATGTSRFVDSSLERIEVRAEGLLAERHVVIVNGHRLPMRPTSIAGEHVAGVRFRAWAPPHSLQPHLGIHHPIRLEVVDTWGKRSLGACAYHVWHPEGRGYDTPPLTRFEAAARRAQRFTAEGPTSYPVDIRPADMHADAPHTLDLRRLPGDRPPPEAIEPEDAQPYPGGVGAQT